MKQTSENKDYRFIVAAILVEVLLALMMFVKIGNAAVTYLIMLLPLLGVTALLGIYTSWRREDSLLLMAFLILTAIGMAFQISADSMYSIQGAYSPLKTCIGFGAAIVLVHMFDLFRRFLNKPYTVYIMIAATAAIYGLLYFKGYDPNGYGTKAWVLIGGHTLQMTDFTKVTAMVFYSSLFAEERQSAKKILVLSTVFFLINFAGAVLIHELGSFFILFFLHLSLLFIFMDSSKEKRVYLITVFVLCLLGVLTSFVLYRLIAPAAAAGELSRLQRLLWPIVKKVYQRFSVAYSIRFDPYGAGYQIMQGKKALWMAGFFGNTVNFSAIPVAESDMAFVALINSYGFLAGFLTLFMFLIIMIRGSNLARALFAKSKADAVVVYVCTILLFLQAMLVILGSTGIIPLAGLPIPFLSRGGTYQAIVFCFSGLLLHMSREKQAPQEGGTENAVPQYTENPLG
ncbi:MAG: FtsW/RodA/SpoVE family cell cycle protein [Solobacterium sp.]|nr:FtsW/RodA/SpoVE family cell cycle protein [Solobacterium sp.]